MNPLLVNTRDTGGAAISCIRLHKALLANNIDSHLQLLEKTNSSITNSFEFRPPLHNAKRALWLLKKIFGSIGLYNEDRNKAIHFLNHRSEKLEAFSFPNSNYDICASPKYKEADIINLHWVSEYIDYPSFFTKADKPIVWTLHDMNAFTGGEHYQETMVGIDKKGYPIKRELSPLEIHISKENLEIKKRALNDFENLHIVAPSQWLSSEAKKSELFSNYNVSTIPYGIDSSIFKKRDKSYSRELLGLPPDKIIVLFVSENVLNKRKGIDYILHTLQELSDTNVHFCAIGNSNAEMHKQKNISFLGQIKDELLMSVAYSAADVFIIPSLMDNLPNTAIESILCGTPVIGFPAGGITDIIDHGQNGILCDEISAPSLIKALHEFMAQTFSFDANSIEKLAKQKYDPNNQAKSYIDLYSKILQK